MEFWDEKATPVILAAVEAACEAVKGNLSTELQRRDQIRHAFLTDEVDRLRDVAARAEQLEKDNLELRQQLNDLRERQHRPSPVVTGSSYFQDPDQPNPTSSSTTIPGRQVLGEISPNKLIENRSSADWQQAYEDLKKEHRILQARFAEKRSASRKVRQDKDTWRKYAEQQERKVERLEAKIKKLQDNNALPSGPDATSAIIPTVDTRDSILNASFISNPETNSSPKRLEGLHYSVRGGSLPASAVPRRPENDEAENQHLAGDEALTVPDSEPELPNIPYPSGANCDAIIKQEPSSDTPIVISERNLRKRKHEETDDLRTRPPGLKFEHAEGSDPVVTGELTSFSPHESLDLDADQGLILTPKKQRTVMTVEGVVAGFVNSPVLGGLPHDVERRMKHSVPPDAPEAGPKGSSDDMDLGFLRSPVLGDLSHELKRRMKRSLPWDVAEAEPNGSSHDPDMGLDRGIADVAEDDEAVSSPPVARPNLKLSGKGRLQDLLNQTTPEADPVKLKPARQAPADTFETELDLMALRFQKRKPGTSVSTPVRATPIPKFNRSAPIRRYGKPELKSAPLRGKPVSELRIGDFKVNPKFNNGYKHAFDEVVRDKAGRAELDGCIDSNCCGKKFRAMAQSELDNGGPEIVSRPDNVRLMEAYLGDEAFRLIGMAHEDKAKLWIEAKTRDLANKYGRHRHRFARRPSPPGFWDADFPTTQEVQENREEGERMEKQIVEERWREAMRPEGRWLFRDE
ncbi:DNA repair protein endonuclease SAE2/CtIP C-terminus-domain-containing protein [Echria macrotheca]|uniref:DNA repair protein endonuclease SAE2/CtIP C-terminus-domain-containing protein n=1 Tax=Echria macrotheca TaxID=438768 RepID=A0AAJ0F6H7_9PEZI|nr:DNA repair protein endonuclease SAE2/CtIP C-terminus-domain-containing protein [Echria macrotheca]